MTDARPHRSGARPAAPGRRRGARRREARRARLVFRRRRGAAVVPRHAALRACASGPRCRSPLRHPCTTAAAARRHARLGAATR
eukprot:scaffold118924_cov39-Phaeocystis_antarctica.AAC.1